MPHDLLDAQARVRHRRCRPVGVRGQAHVVPFEPTAEELQYLQAGKPLFFADKPRTTPDEAKWPGRVPFGAVALSWQSNKAAMGDAKKAAVHVHARGIGLANVDVNVNFRGSEGGISLTGALEAGQEIELVIHMLRAVAASQAS